jgi:hypothetical protein
MRWRSRTLPVAFFGALAMLTVGVGCEETRRSLGEECLRNEDCLSGTCSARTCVSERPVVSTPVETPTPGVDAGSLPDTGTATDADVEGG